MDLWGGETAANVNIVEHNLDYPREDRILLRRLGYVAVSLSIEARANRTLILRRATPERLSQLIEQNLIGLRSVLEYNISKRILLFRIGSQVIPFGGHPVNALAWSDEFSQQLEALGELARRHNLRLSFHPGQYTVLSSPNEEVTSAAVRDLAWHAAFLDSLGLDASHKLVVHGGGAYGDKASALNRWILQYQRLSPSVQRRLVLENDERIYNVADVLEVSDRVGVPVVFDHLHHQLNPGSQSWPMVDVLRRCFATWGNQDGPPKIHFSSQRSSAPPGAHADYANDLEFVNFLRETPPQSFDCMLEAKAKDLALLQLRETLQREGFQEEDLGSPASPPGCA